MDTAHQIHGVIEGSWKLFKDFGFEALSDEQWEKLVQNQKTVLLPKGQKLGDAEYFFARAVMTAIDNYYREKGQLQEYAKKD